MLIALACIAGYIGMSLGFILWDAYIGTGLNYDSSYNDTPPLPVVALFWWISIPVVCLMKFTEYSREIKEKRIERQSAEEMKKKLDKKRAEKLRIATEKEEEAILEQVEKELRFERADKKLRSRE